MTPDQRRAHLILHGQTLLDEWTQSDKLQAKGRKLRDEGHNMLRADGRKLRAEGGMLYAEGEELWADAVLKEFGPGCTMTWDGGTCTLSVGEVYLPVT